MNRRTFVKSAAVASAALSSISLSGNQPILSGKSLRVGIVGCGGRCKQITKSLLEAAELIGIQIKFVAIADVFADRIQAYCNKFKLPTSISHLGMTAYHRVMESDADIVILTTPPSFRPVHLNAAVESGKHCFVEKPVAVDPVGARRILEIGEVARQKNISIVAGTQRRYDLNYRSAYEQIKAGAIGEITGGSIYWNGRIPWIAPRTEQQTDSDYLIRNWLNFTELSGDHIVEQHIHQIDVANWFMGRPPKTFLGMGGRARRETGNQFDFFSVDFEYGDGIHIQSQCRQIAGCYNRVGESFMGTKGHTLGTKVIGESTDLPPLQQEHPSGQVQEFVELFKAVLEEGPTLNDAEAVALSTLCAVGARLSAYTGELIRWVDLVSNVDSPWYAFSLSPSPLDFESGSVVVPSEKPTIPGSGEAIRIRA